jgi:exodeoxyribonuclease VIII
VRVNAATFRGHPIAADGSATINGTRYAPEWIAAECEGAASGHNTLGLPVGKHRDGSSILTLAHGLHRDYPAERYHERVMGLASKGALDRFHRSPAHYLAWVSGDAKDEASPALAFGSAFHCAALEPERFASEYLVEPTFRGKGSVKARAAWREEHAEQSFLDADDARAIAGMVASLRAHPLAAELLEEGEPEVTLRWRDAATGIECKARGDFYARELGVCVDLKSTSDARADSFERSIANFTYHRQHGFYADGFDALDAALERFVFVAIEKEPPYAVSVFVLDEDAIRRGRFSIREDLERLRECIDRDHWPAYAETMQEISLPRWATR